MEELSKAVELMKEKEELEFQLDLMNKSPHSITIYYLNSDAKITLKEYLMHDVLEITSNILNERLLSINKRLQAMEDKLK